MNFNREINRLMIAMMAAFSVILLAAAYYTVVGSITLILREDNPRLVEAQQSILRGSIYDRNGVLLAQTRPDDEGFAVREYLETAMNSALGYYSYRYGAGGTEAAFDEALSGVNLPPTFSQLVLAQPTQGEDIQLTLDLSIQERIVRAMGDHHGAAVMMSLPDGEILAFVSLPTYDPNTLNANWETFIEAEGNPFFNRVLQGRYQPGTMLQLPLMVDAITRGQSIEAQFPNGGAPVQLDDLTLTCVLNPQQRDLTLGLAFVYGCPAPFTRLVPVLSAERMQNQFDVLHLLTPPTLTEYTTETEPADVDEFKFNDDNLRKNILGQGELTFSPIAVNALMAAIANSGNSPQPHIINATRPPNGEWSPVLMRESSIPYMTRQTARQMQNLLQQSAQEGTASSAAWGSDNVYAQAAIAYSGDSTLVWFSGYTQLSNQQQVVITIVLENTDNITEAVTIGQEALSAARTAAAASS